MDHLRELLRSSGAQIVFLQEVMGVHPPKVKDQEWKLESQFEFLADQVWHHHAYGRNAVHSNGHHGNAILSQFPIVFHNNKDISTNSLERRGILHAAIEFPDTDMAPLDLLCVHLNLTARGRRAQLQLLNQFVESQFSSDQPLILAGDFNDWRKEATATLERFIQVKEAGVEFHGRHQPSFPSWLPWLSLDRIYVRRFRVLKHVVIRQSDWKKMSDHLPILVDLELTPAAARIQNTSPR